MGERRVQRLDSASRRFRRHRTARPRINTNKHKPVMTEMDTQTTFWTTGRIIATVVVAGLIATVGYTLLSGHRDENTNLGLALPGSSVSDPRSTRIPPDF